MASSERYLHVSLCVHFCALFLYLVWKVHKALHGSSNRLHPNWNSQILPCMCCTTLYNNRSAIILPQKTKLVKWRYYKEITRSLGRSGFITSHSDKCSQEQYYGGDACEWSPDAGTSLHVPASHFPPLFREKDRLGESLVGRQAFGMAVSFYFDMKMSTDLSFDWNIEAMISDSDGRVSECLFCSDE